MEKKEYTIILATYNGERFIEQQLDSLRLQSIAPKEVLIVDDGSTDQTISIIRKYIKHHQLTHWQIIVNEVNKGWRRNFVESISFTSTEFVLFSDQDDIWQVDKAEKQLTVFEEQPQAKVVVTGYQVINAKNEWVAKKSFSGQTKKICLNYRNYAVQSPGCSYAIRKSFYEEIRPFWHERMAHDAYFWWLGMLTESLIMIDEPLLLYRRHGNNVSGNIQSREEVVEKIQENLVFVEKLQQANAAFNFIQLEDLYSSNEHYLKKYQQYFHVRKQAYMQRNYLKLLAATIKFSSCYRSYPGKKGKRILSDIKQCIRKSSPERETNGSREKNG